MSSPPDSVAEVIVFSGCPSVRPSVRSFGQILLPRYLMNGLSNVDETYKEYSLAPTDDLIRYWRSKVNGQGHSRLSKWRRYPRRILSSCSELFKGCQAQAGMVTVSVSVCRWPPSHTVRQRSTSVTSSASRRSPHAALPCRSAMSAARTAPLCLCNTCRPLPSSE